MAVVYSTSDVHPRDSADYWRDVVTRDFVKIVMTRDARNLLSGRASAAARAATSAFGLTRPILIQPIDGTRHLAYRQRVLLRVPAAFRPIRPLSRRQALAVEDGSFFLLDPRRPFTGRMRGEARCCPSACRGRSSRRVRATRRTGVPRARFARPGRRLGVGLSSPCCPSASTQSTRAPPPRSARRRSTSSMLALAAETGASGVTFRRAAP